MPETSPPLVVTPTWTEPTGIAARSILNALCCGRINQFGIIGGFERLSDDFSYYDIQWSAIGDITDWPIPLSADARAKQSGVQRFPIEFGWVTAIASGDFYGYVFQENAITKVTYVGGDVVFNFDTFEEYRGCVAPGRMEQVDDLIFFKSSRGFHVLENDVITDIGHGIVDDTYGQD